LNAVMGSRCSTSLRTEQFSKIAERIAMKRISVDFVKSAYQLVESINGFF
jgi:hypothetical protein